MNLKRFLVKLIKKTEKTLNISFSKNILKKVIDKKIKGIGNIEDIKIDSTLRVFYLEISLKEESQNLKIAINKYNISDKNDYLVIRDIDINKAWMNEIAQKYLINKKISIPEKYRDYIEYFK